ncbi:aminotransferase class IV [Pedobacter antarcticus]|uniref:aminotransferase class IV n=1 Tax=Pedobacter antarcticus TaxID=34086 RepID=UPI001C580F86|nr:aminotransferase class IV [Pedobacter antarcticus]
MSNKQVFINDRFVPLTAASLQISDLSIQRGYGIFDFFKTVNGKAIFLEDHLDRFFSSAAQMHLEIDLDRKAIVKILEELTENNQIPDSGIRLTLTGGYSSDGYLLNTPPNLVISQTQLQAPLILQEQGIKLMTFDYQRQLSGIKTLDYAMAIWLQPTIRQAGAHDVLYHNQGWIRECPRANFFIVNHDQEIVTAATQILPGVIRKNILSLAAQGFRIVERDFNLEELANASEAFITSTTKHLLPVLEIDGKAVGTGHTGKVTKTLFEQITTIVKKQAGL